MPEHVVSRFTLVEPFNDGLLALFHTMTRAVGLIDADDWNTFKSNGRGTNGYGSEKQVNGETLSALADQGFIVPRHIDETEVLAHWRTSQAYDQTHMTYMISPTHACNMACSYCVHGDRKRPEHMDMDTARMVLDFIIRDINARRPLDIRLDFGGAEAVLNPKVMLYLAEGLHRYCQGRGLSLKCGLISNGLALNPDLIGRLSAFGLERVRVTINGPKEIHDRCRVARDGGATYHRIMDNLTAIAGLVDIGIQGQYDPTDSEYRSFPRLLDDLADRGLRDRVVLVAFGPIVPTEPDSEGPPFRSMPDPDGRNSIQVDRAAPVDCLWDEDPSRPIWLEREIDARGFPRSTDPPANHCLANYRNTLVIDVDGSLIVCPSMMDYPELAYGHVRSGVDFRKEAALLARPLPDICRHECAIAPLCDGGCRLQALQRTGNFGGVNCLKVTFEALVREFFLNRIHSMMPTE